MIKKKEKTEKPKGTEEQGKPTKEKKLKEKKASDNTFFSSLLILIISTVLAASLVSGFLFWKAQEMIVGNNNLVKEQTLDTYTKLVNSQVLLLQRDITNFVTNISSDSRIYEMDQMAIELINESAKQALPDSIDFKVFLLGRYDINKDDYPPVNFATQKQLLASERAEQILPAYYKNPKGDYFSVASSIKNPNTNELLYTIIVSYPAEKVFQNLPTQALDNTRISLVQTFERGEDLSIFTLGRSTGNKNKELKDSIHPNWKIEYISNQKEALLSNVYIALAITFAIFILFTVISALLVTMTLKKNFTADSSLIYEFVRSGNKKTINTELFKTDLMKGLHGQLKQIKLATAQNKTSGHKLSKKDDENFDIDIAASDENLFGGDTPAEVESGAAQPSPAQASTIPASIFRAYDIRGIVDETLTAEGVKQIGQAIGSESISQGESTIIIARDGRLSGPALSEALKQGILSSGANVIDIGMVPTPVLYYACKTLDAQSGVMLTGSHNPSNHNGLKIVINGITLAEQGIQNLRENIERGNLASGEGSASEENILPAYIEAIENDVILAQPMNIVVDCGNGVTGVLAKQLFEEIGCNVTPLYEEVDGNFPNHHPDPGQPKNLQDLIAKVQETGAHLGIAFDGDGDRLGIVTNAGKIIWPDRLMMLFAKDILTRNPGADIIFDVKCSNTLADIIRKQGGRPLMWKTGHSLIKAKMQENGAQLAGEMSGHIFFNDRWFGFDDGLYSAARLLEILSTDSKTCDEVFAEFPEMVSTPELNIPVDDEGKFDMVTMLASVGDFGKGAKTDIDGIRIDYNYGWGLIRASNTTANLVARFEANSEEKLAEIQALFKEQILKIQSDLDIPF